MYYIIMGEEGEGEGKIWYYYMINWDNNMGFCFIIWNEWGWDIFLWFLSLKEGRSINKQYRAQRHIFISF